MDILQHGTYDFPVQWWKLRRIRLRAVAIGKSAALAALGLASLPSCSQTSPADPALVINLRWVQNYSGETRGNVDTGLYWALSFLGAKLPAPAKVLIWHGRVVTVNLGAAQVQPDTKAAWKKLLQVLRSSDEYRKMGAIDIGRFVLLSLCSANHYYELTGTSPTLSGFLGQHTFEPRKIAVVESGVAHGNRLIEVGSGGVSGTTVFLAYEGRGSLKDGSFEKEDIETLEFMQNGQLHFALYDLSGHLKPVATVELTKAGKPSKCLWCHEINLNPPFLNRTDLPGYYSTQDFKDLVARQMRLISGYRQTLKSKVDFRKTQDHTNAENLYMSFAQPTAERLAAEWSIPVDDVRRILRAGNLKPHPHSVEADDGILGDALYDRGQVDALAPYTSVHGPTDFREPSGYEPDLLR
jgi:hypothetical protein